MRVKSLISLFVASTALLFLDSCSRESPLKENVGLQNNHSRVFASREPFKDPQAFIDSMANTPVDTTNIVPDTLTVTVNDSIYLIGILPRFVEKIYLFQWNMIDGDSTVSIKGDNAEPFAWAYKKPGVYYPQFIAFDGNNATDTAGTGTKRLYVNVIDTKPVLGVPKDTLWTSNKGDVKFGIFAADSFGTIKNVKIDLDASGKDSATVWKYEQEEGDDSLYVTIKNDKNYIDSLGNQTIYVIIEDDDGNETLDSVYLHFNRPPTLNIISPLDGSRHSIKERFYFYYESEDEDNPQDLRYFIRAQISKNGKPPQKALTEADFIAKNISVNIFEPTTEDGRNVITLLNDPSTELTGRIYWEMYVSDGYDIVEMERIATSDSTSRPWNFYLGDLSSTQGTFFGVAKYEGRDNHAGIRIQFNNGSKIFDGFTDKDGNYTIKADVGSYEVRASSDSIREYEYAFQYDLFIESGMTLKVDPLILADTTSPTLVFKNQDTLDIRKIESMNIYAKDLASRVNAVTAKLNDNDVELTCIASDQGVIVNCGLTLENLLDGDHVLAITAKDNVGNTNTIKDTLFVRATKLALDVNGVQKDKIGKNSTKDLDFTAVITNAYPAADSVLWSWDIEGKTDSKKVAIQDGKATIKLSYANIIKNFDDPDDPKHAETDFTMTAAYANNGADVKSTVKFGVLSSMPTIVFAEPGSDVKVTINDPVKFSVVAYPGESSTSMEITWNCGTNLSDGYTCPVKDATEGTLAFKTLGEHEVVVTVKDDHGDVGTDKITVSVISDKPAIVASTNDKSNEYKINSRVKVNLVANDKQGKVSEIKWGCTANEDLEKIKNDNTVTISPAASIETTVEVQLTSQESKNFRCLFRALDDDAEEGRDTLTFVTLLDPPVVQLKTKSDAVKINSEQKIIATATDKLGKITKYEIACGENLKSLPAYVTMSKPDTTALMPSYATDYYCVVQVTDDDNNTARDTATYKVLVGKPTVKASVNYTKVTINDKVELNAHAVDSLGSIIKYEWGCGSKSAKNIGFTYSSATTPKTTMTMPNVADANYLCIIKVTDDDSNEARDSVEINIIQAPPTVKVSKDHQVIREEMNILLNATASDNNGVPTDEGEIVKKEWSCAIPEKISSNWKTVSDLDTVWKAPAANNNLICVARVTDNDGNVATDTMTFTYTSELPKIWVTSELIYYNQGDEIDLNAKINNAWQGIDWFSWECVEKATGTTMESKVPKYSYKDNGESFAIYKDSSYTEAGKDMYCIVSAQESSSKEVFKDTTEIRIMKNFPVGVITAPDTVYLWNGDETLPEEAQFFCDEKCGAHCSKRGELSPANSTQEYRWNFNTTATTFYNGPDSGRSPAIDVYDINFHNYFLRPSEEGSFTLYLDYRDSVTPNPVTNGFRLRHQAEVVSKTIYFRRAWQNLSKDTVVATAKSTVTPALAFVGSKPVSAYLENKSVVKVSVYNNGNWTHIGSFDATDSVTSIQLASDGKDLYIGALTTKKDFIIKKSANASNEPANLSSFSNVRVPKLISSSTGKIAFVYYSSTNQVAVQTLNSEAKTWTNKDLTKSSTNLIELEATYTKDGNLVIVYVNTNYKGYAAVYDASLTSKIAPAEIPDNPNHIGIAVDGNTLYMSSMDYDWENASGFKSTPIDGASFSWSDHVSIFDEAFISFHTSIAARNGVVYVAIDNSYAANLSQVQVFRFENNKWHYHGETDLPYFMTPFFNKNKYYLRGFAPVLQLDDSGKLHLSILGTANGSSTSKNNGPIVMKYVADNWKINSTCEEK